MKFRKLEDNTIIEIQDKNRIKKFQGYPDLYEEIKEEKEQKDKVNKKKEKEND